MIVAGITEQGLAANVAEYYGIPLAGVHFYPMQVLELGWLDWRITKEAENAHRRALGLPEAPAASTPALEIQAYDELFARVGNRMGGPGCATALRRRADAGAADGRRR
jgi:vancomycin aglycone glucosyltransferase